ncbi:cytochrome c3 family protein [Carboxydothermus ferrireducens]|uniref:CXXCH cytochrome family protein n=1 Tax=Carboxydothermus ferrireducens DSM 11255 TaxID=1119529 RepID=A0ABX2REW2_9THEO|nr:cytochrome c3 family protein [Carboxydothermus ferrireducens]NYE58375.1 putative CXXCH cytochrome family protein [Carboxydothermus ferrireducens DSM 11255]
MRKGLVLILAVLMLIIFTATAYAAQVLVPTTDKDVYGPGSYIPTPTSKTVYGYNNSPAKFNADGTTYYPNEIYLPNEQNPASYRIHSNYSKNTDACAACHATHTAVGQTLLQWGTVYDTCMACHDGTIGTTYNVEEGYIANTGNPTFGGMFGTGSESSLSRHNVVGSVQIFAAPGGNTTGNYEINNTPDKANATAWDITFGCESCHSPHGLGGNARILNPNVNAYSYLNYKSNIEYIYNEVTGYYENAQKFQWVRSYPYNKGTQVWVNGQLKTEGVDYILDGTSGETKIKLLQENGSVTVVYAYFYPALKVKMEVKDYLKSSEFVQHTYGINQFCGACHTDYNTDTGNIATSTGSSDKLTGQYTEAYRHQVGFKVDEFKAFLPLTNMVYEKRSDGDVMTCLTCHYAHGTSKDFWTRTLTNDYWSGQVIDEIAGSSALKRAPNMGTCETCHRKGPANEGYAANAGESNAVTPTANVSDGTSQANAKFVGSAKCVECHAAYAEGIKETYHNNMATYYNIDKNSAPSERAYKGSVALLSVFNDNPALKTTAPFVYIWDAINGKTSTFDVVLWGKPDEAAYVAVWDGSAYQRKAELEYNKTTGKYELVSKSGTLTCINCHSVNNYTFAKATPLTTDVAQQIYNVGIPYISLPQGVTDFYYNAGGTPKATLRTLITNGGVVTASDGTGVVELQINCEACHGPGSAHVAAPSSKNITGWKQYNYAVRVGLPFQTKDGALTGISLPTKAQSCGSCHNSNTHQGFYYKSKHFVNGQMDCMVCHDPHSDKYEYQLKLPVKSLCMSCHDAGVATGNIPVFTREDTEKFLGYYSTAYHLFDDMGTINEATYAATNNLLP